MKHIPVIRLTMVREGTVKYESNAIKSPEDAVKIFENFLEQKGYLDRENFMMMTLNTKNKTIGLNMVSVGSLNSSIVHPREVFKLAILQNARSIIVAHNHPSGDTNPSKEDIELTKRLVEAGEILGIDVLDHLVIGDDYTSLATEGYIK
jgi:DNA repair protein RadC